MTKIFASKILTSSGWKENITLEINADGHIEKLKDITTLKEEGAISQAEFRRLKKKIMDSI